MINLRNVKKSIKMTKGQMLDSIFNSVQLSESHIFFSFFLLLLRILLYTDWTFLSRLPRFIRVLSKMEYILFIQNGGSKVADGSSSFLIINDFILTPLLLLRIHDLSIIPRQLAIIISYPTSASKNNCSIGDAHKISRILLDFNCKSNRLLACF